MELNISGKTKTMKVKEELVFPTEAHLVRAIIQNGHHTSRGVAHLAPNVISEFESSAGKADVIYFHLHSRWRQNIQYARLPARWVFSLRTLPLRKTFSVEDFAFTTGVLKRTATRILSQYEQLGYCRRSTQRGHWLKVRQPIPIAKKIIAVEAKLGDWKRALVQAYCYQRYANQSWVVLDASKSRGAVNATSQFRRLNVGLKVLSRSGVTKTYVTPRARSAKSPFHFWEANGLIAASLSNARKL